MTRREKSERDAVTRLRAALLDLVSAQRFTEANEIAAIIERIEPPPRGEAAPARAGGSAARSEPGDGIPLPSSAPATYLGDTKLMPCHNCGSMLAAHCTVHLLPCCPGSLMHGQDEGTWTPNATGL